MSRFSCVLAIMMTLAVAIPVQATTLTPIKKVDPVYPVDAMRTQTEGFVEVEFTVAPDGTVQSVSVLNAKPSRTFEKSAVSAVKQWTFTPGGGRGKVRLDFKL